MWLECTARWNCGLLQERLPPKYAVHRLNVKGSDIGDTYDRPRCGCLAVNQERLVLTRGLNEYLTYAGAEPIFAVSGFWNCSEDDEQREIEALAKIRVVPVGHELSWEDVLLPSHRDRKSVYEAQVRQAVALGKMLRDEDVIFDLDQDPSNGHGRMKLLSVTQDKPFLPTLIQHGVIWNSTVGRPLSAIDMLKIHGWPVEPDECEYFGSAAAWRDNLHSGVLTHRQIISMMGDSWHIPVQGKWLMYLLSIIELRDLRMEAPRSPCTPERVFGKLQRPSPGKRTRIHLDADDTDGEATSTELDEVASPNSCLSMTVHGSDSEVSP